jgi:hypothetical protein
MDHHSRHDPGRPPQFGGIAYVEPAKRWQQWLQGRHRNEADPRRTPGRAGRGT